MMIFSTVEKAVELASRTLEAAGFEVSSDTIRNRVLSWYNHTDVADPKVLAACSIEGYFDSDYTYDDMLKAKAYWFN